MGGDYILDANILILLLRDDVAVTQHFVRAFSVAVPYVVLAELYYGARNSRRREENLARIDDLARQFEVLFPDLRTVQEYAVIRAFLKSIGHPIPEADLWIAALAIQHERTVASRDEHFCFVNGLRVESW
jgi:tRNA(fMet)-specific endonuclease VapC